MMLTATVLGWCCDVGCNVGCDANYDVGCDVGCDVVLTRSCDVKEL
jgi:hypothetical protein